MYLALAILALGGALALPLWICAHISYRAATTEPQCARCSYSLVGNVSGICPECGTTLTDETVFIPGQRRPIALRWRIIGWSACCLLAYKSIPAMLFDAIDETLPLYFNYIVNVHLQNTAGPKDSMEMLVEFANEDPSQPARLLALRVREQDLLSYHQSVDKTSGGLLLDPATGKFSYCHWHDARDLENRQLPASASPILSDAEFLPWLTGQGVSDPPAFVYMINDLRSAAATRTGFDVHLKSLYEGRPKTGVRCSGYGGSSGRYRIVPADKAFALATLAIWGLGCFVLHRRMRRGSADPITISQAL